ncbi:MAG: hypothetical protein SVX43_04595 [Cyanobacteriota bacterium]|nr:hypothetical protein [Cyanobacteriota bacterium]
MNRRIFGILTGFLLAIALLALFHFAKLLLLDRASAQIAGNDALYSNVKWTRGTKNPRSFRARSVKP